MVERICPMCQHGNPLDDRFCGKCGAPLERQALVRRDETRLALIGRNLPVTWRQLGRTVALGAAALAAEAGLAWLRRRLADGSLTTALTRATPTPPPTQATPSSAPAIGRAVTIISQRVIEIWEGDDGRGHMVDRQVWRRTEE